MDLYLISRLPKAESDAFAESVVREAPSLVGAHYTATVREVIRTGAVDTVITTLRNVKNPAPESYLRDRGMTYIFSGYTVDEVTTANVRRYFPRGGRDERPVLRSPGGIYSYVTVRHDDGQLFAGHSTPTLEPVFYAQRQPSVHVGNHPLLVHMAAVGFSGPQIDEHFYLSAIAAGTALDDTTPFLGTYRVPPRAGLLGHRNVAAVEVVPVPRPRSTAHRVDTYQHRRSAMGQSLIEATSILRRLPAGELRTSGGKDSRLLASALREGGYDVVPVNQNFPQEIEGQIADRVAQVLGHEACIRRPIGSILSRDNILQATRRKIAYSAGLPAIATMQYPTRTEGEEAGTPVIMGHAHLQRGGLNLRIRTLDHAYAAAESRTVSGMLLPPYQQANRKRAQQLVNRTIRRTTFAVQAVAYHAYVDAPANYQLQSLYTYTRNWNHLVTPLLDERFALLCEDISDARAARKEGEHPGITDLFFESLAMGVTEDLAPELLTFPLAGARYKCDGEEWSGFQLRDPDSVTSAPIPAESLKGVFNTRRLNTGLRAELWEQIEGTVVADMVRSTCRAEVIRYVSEPSTPEPEGHGSSALSQFVWGLFGLSIILGSDWWTELAK